MKVITEKTKVESLLTRAVSEVIVSAHLKEGLESGKKLRVKFGIDPTAPDIHLGHAVSLMKLKEFQNLGHQAVLIIGDFTARIGDPTGRIEARKILSPQAIKQNLKGYLKQAGKIIDIEKTEIRYNNEWFGKMGAVEFYNLAGKVTVQQIIKREDFKKRIQNDQNLTLNEMMYPIFQGYDSVMVKADIEIGGEDQKVNLLMGRRVQRAYGMPEQDILTLWLLEGTDGTKKMSKSSGNFIGVSEKPEIMFGKIMSIPDALIVKYFRALTAVPDLNIDKFEEELKNPKINPRDIKKILAGEIVKIYHGEKKAEKAMAEFERVFTKKELPENIQEITITAKKRDIVELLIQLHLALSKGEARRLVIGNAVKVDGKIISDFKAEINARSGMIVQAGKRHFARIKTK
ncbi:MAG: tyrosine--tRNA ligase [Candidatus Azambacteria bacterium]|nr:tyrosine--tRNA ligase [Candidatus Azambacteria bacterium]